MPGKKTDTTASNDSTRRTAPTLPKTVAKQIKTDSSPDSDTAGQRITVRKTSTAAEPQPQVAEPAVPSADTIDNLETDKAVDDIMAEESDMVLAVDDIMAAKRSQKTQGTSWKDKLRSLLHNKWTWIGLAVILCFLLGLPFTRYKLLGIVIKKNVSVKVMDSQTGTPVSNAQVALGGVDVKTDANGLAKLKVGVGEKSLIITKQYYRTTDVHYFVGFSGNPASTIKLVATGRLVPITIDNTISGKPVLNAVIRILDTTAKTNNKGEASIALPTGTKSDKASISLVGYNTKQVSVQVTAAITSANSFTLTPSGTIYFLSKAGGLINVMKSNLDGSAPQTVLAGTGHETASTTRLFASHDWRYLALEANRGGTQAELYLINTSNKQVTEFDSSNSTFNPIGWSGHDFLYSLTANTGSQWQSGTQAIKDYDADQQQLNELDQNQAAGDSTSYAYQSLSNIFLAGNALVYDTQWTAQGGYDLSSDNDTIRVFQLGSQAKKDYESFPASSTGLIAANRYQPQSVYFEVPSSSAATSYYQYANQSVQTASINQTIFNQTNPSYLLSPSGNHTVWFELSNGQDLFLTGNSNAGNQQQIAALDGYVPYGWYSDSYILASKDNDQLYILPSSGLSGAQTPFKITAYYEPNGSNNSYEYGGL